MLASEIVALSDKARQQMRRKGILVHSQSGTSVNLPPTYHKLVKVIRKHARGTLEEQESLFEASLRSGLVFILVDVLCRKL